MKKLCTCFGMGLLLSTLPAAAGSMRAPENVTPSGTTLYFPDYVDGEGWSVQLALSNPDATRNAAVVVTAYDPHGHEVSGFFDSGTRFEMRTTTPSLRSGCGLGNGSLHSRRCR